jgi:glycosyltransferase involved in cell wall biosynthesis
MKTFQGVTLHALPAFRHKFCENILHTLLGTLVSLKYKTDILHFQAVGSALLIPLARLLGMKVVFTSHGSEYERRKWGTFAKLVLKLSEFIGITFANEVIAISRNIADEIKEKYDRNTTVIPNGVYIPRIARGENNLKKYNLGKKKYVLSVGRFVPEKGFHTLINAFNMAALDGFKLVIAGDADHQDTYSCGLKKSVLKNENIILPGFVTGEALQELFSYAALFVLPSYYEGLSIVLLEALSYGLSCIASDIPANRNMNLAEERFFKPGDERMLSEMLKRYVPKPLSEEEKEKQINTLAAKYDWESIAQKTLAVYDEVINLCS